MGEAKRRGSFDERRQQSILNNINTIKQEGEIRMNRNMGRPSVAPGILPGITMDQLKQSTCQCGGKEFTPIFQVYFASQFQTVTGNIMAVQVPYGFHCSLCGTPLGNKKEDKVENESA